VIHGITDSTSKAIHGVSDATGTVIHGVSDTFSQGVHRAVDSIEHVWDDARASIEQGAGYTTQPSTDAAPSAEAQAKESETQGSKMLHDAMLDLKMQQAVDQDALGHYPPLTVPQAKAKQEERYVSKAVQAVSKGIEGVLRKEWVTPEATRKPSDQNLGPSLESNIDPNGSKRGVRRVDFDPAVEENPYVLENRFEESVEFGLPTNKKHWGTTQLVPKSELSKSEE
jgi:hypothetical protein